MDLLAEYAIAEFGPITQDLLLQGEFIWGTEEGNELTATNPNIVQHLHGVDGENRLIGSDGRNFFYGGPQADTIETGGGDNVVYADPIPTLGQHHAPLGGNNKITTGDGNNQIFAFNGENEITLGDGDNVVYTGIGSDHVFLGLGNNYVNTSAHFALSAAFWSNGQVIDVPIGGDRNIADYTDMPRSLVVKAPWGDPLTGRRNFTVDKIDPDGVAATTTDLLTSIQEIRFAPHPNTVMLTGTTGGRYAIDFLSDVGPEGTIHTIDLTHAIGNSHSGGGVTVRHAENEDAFTIGDMKFVGFSRIIGSAYRDDIDLSDTTRNLIIDSGTGGADITTGSGNDIIRMQGEGEVDAGGGFNILDRSQLEGESTFAFSFEAGGWVASINGEATVRNVQHYKGSQGDNTFTISNANAPSEDLLVLEGNVGDDEFLVDLTHFFLPPALALIGGDGDDRFVVDSIFDVNAGPVIINPGDGNDVIELNGTIFNSWFEPTFATISDIGRLADLDVATLRNPASGAGVVIIVNATLADRIWVNGVEETYDRTPTLDLDNFLLAPREFLDDSDLPEVQLPDEEAALDRLSQITFPTISTEFDPHAHLNPMLGGHPHPDPDPNPDPDPDMAELAIDGTYTSLTGTDGDDVLTGSAADEHFDGGRGDDVIHAVAGDNIIDGGRGNDHMISGTGADTFVFRLAYGRNFIEGFDVNRDRIALDALTPDDLAFHDLGTASMLAANDGTWFWFDGMTGIEFGELSFIDLAGQPLTLTPPPPPSHVLVQGTAGDDVLIGSDSENNHILGGAGDDFLYGVGGDNILDGGTGNDFMTSGTGSDTFVFRLGDGENVIEGFDIANDRIALDGVDPADLALYDYGSGSLLLASDGTEFWFIGMTGYAITDITFVDMNGEPIGAPPPSYVLVQGTAGDDVLIGSGSENNIILGGAGDDFLYGVGGDNILDGGTGNDFMTSGAGSDTFVFRLGDGQNTIENFDVTQDRIALDGLLVDDLDFSDYGSGSLLSALDGTEFWFIGMTGLAKSSLVFVNHDQPI